MQDRNDLVEQLRSATIKRVTFDKSANAGYIYLESTRNLNIVEENIIDIRIEETLSVETSYWTVLDIDNVGRLVGVEILDPRNLTKALRENTAV